jgi:hypothetical protein
VGVYLWINKDILLWKRWMLETIRKQIYLGSFKLHGDKIDFDHAINRQEMLALGDVVYFMVYKDDILKVGKAGGGGGFYSRMGQYKRGLGADATNDKIIRTMNELMIESVEIYAIQAPRNTHTTTCIKGNDLVIETPTNVGLEKYYLNLLKESYSLIFCQQLS